MRKIYKSYLTNIGMENELRVGLSAAILVFGLRPNYPAMFMVLTRRKVINGPSNGYVQGVTQLRFGHLTLRMIPVHSSIRMSGRTATTASHGSSNRPKSESLKPHPLQLLPRPLGLKCRPRWMPLSKEEKKKELLDEEKRHEKATIL